MIERVRRGIVYRIRDQELIVLVVMLGHRREIYERARRERPGA